MKKYTTKPIDYTGCHPVIEEHLKRGEAIECEVWDDEDSGHDKRKRYITGYIPGAYIMPNGVFWSHAEPILIKAKIKRIMPPGRAIPVLIAEGWAFTSTGSLAGPSFVLAPYMYALMGGDVDGEANEFAWPPCIIEEVEDDE